MSDILIKNMKMPDNCEKCELSKAVITGLSTYRLCPILRRTWRRGKPEPTCPLIEVPQHGRLTNADRIRVMSNEELADFLDSIGDGCEWCADQELCHMMYDTKFSCKACILQWLKAEVKE